MVMKNEPPPTPERASLAPAQMIREVPNLPSAPKVLPRLKRLLLDPNSSMDDVVALVRLDAPIAAHVLQVSNSAYFNKGLRCTDVEEAVNRVGYGLVYELVSYAVASQVLVRPLEVYGLGADAIWQQSVACALAAEHLTRFTGDDGSLAYTLGLLHRIGMVVVNEWTLRQRRGLRLTDRGYPVEFTADERRVFGFDQAELGAVLLRSWDFDAETTGALRAQYAPPGAAGPVRLGGLLQTARWIREAVCRAEAVPEPPDRQLLASLHLTTGQLEMAVADVRTRLGAINTLLDERGPEEINPRRAAAPGRNCLVPEPVRVR